MSFDLQNRIAATLAATHSSGNTTFMGLAEAVIRTISAYRREVSEDDFLDALLADDE